MPLVEQLKPKNNSAASYFPVSANSANNKYEWETVVGFFIKSLHNIELEKTINSLDDFKLLCKTQITNKLDGEPFWHIIEKMYFDNEQVLNISPEMQALKVLNPESSNAGDERLTAFLVGLLKKKVKSLNSYKMHKNMMIRMRKFIRERLKWLS